MLYELRHCFLSTPVEKPVKSSTTNIAVLRTAHAFTSSNRLSEKLGRSKLQVLLYRALI